MIVTAQSREKRLAITAIALLLACVQSVTLWGEHLRPEEEAPEALLSAQLGGADVDFFISGSWQASLYGSLGFAFPEGSPPFAAQYPGMTQGFSFRQEPDLLLSLWIEERFFFETSIVSGYELNSLQTGYVNPEEGFLRRLILGAPAPPIQSYGETLLPEGAKGSFGVSVETATELSRHDAMLRIEDFGIKTKRFIGTKEVVETVIHPADYITGRFFILPDEAVDFLHLFAESTSTGEGIGGSDGRYYARLPESSYRASTAKGTVVLNESAQKRILVYYEKNGVAVGDPELGAAALAGATGWFPDPSLLPVDFSFSDEASDEAYMGTQFNDLKVSFEDGKNALLLYDPALFSPFAHCGWYDAKFTLPENRADIEIELGSPGAPIAGGRIDFAPSLFDGSQFRVFEPSTDSTEAGARYPLAKHYPYLYGPHALSGDNRVAERILLLVKEETDAFRLENPVTGSVVVRRNGFRDTAFTVTASGELVFDKPVSHGERIDVIYRTDSGGETTQNITFGITNSFNLPGGLFTYLALSGRWNVNPGSYSTRQNQYPGSVTFATGLDFTRPGMEAQVDASLLVSSPDTSGVFRIFGMENAGSGFPVDRRAIFPSSAPSGADETSDLNQYNRGILYYKDYLSYDLSGASTLNRYDWPTLPEEQIFPYEQDNPIGPYAVSTAGDGVGGTAMALDFLLDEKGSWVGAQMPLAPGGVPPDLSSYEGLTFRWKYAHHRQTSGSTDTLTIYVQLGGLGEDLDGDGILDRESSSMDTGMSFNDQARDIRLTVGGWEGRPDFRLTTEDVNGNGVLDAESADLLSRSYDPGSADYPGATWGQEVTIIFTEAEKRLLKRASGFRVLIKSTANETVKNRLLVSGLTLLGSPFSLDPVDAGTVVAREKADSSLAAAYPEVLTRFHTAGEPQRVLLFEWSGIDAAAGWTARGLSFGTPVADYKQLSFYLRGDPLTTGKPELTLSLGRGEKTALSVSFPAPTDNTWRKYSIDLDSGDLLVDGTVVSSAKRDHSIAVVDSLIITLDGSSSGSLSIDEVHLAQARLQTGYTLQAGFSASSSDPLVALDGFPIIDNPYVDLNIASAGSIIENGPASANILFSGTTGGDIAKTASVSLLLNALAGESSYLTGGHRITVPAGPSPVTVTQRFRTTAVEEDPGFVHYLELSGGIPGKAKANLSSEISSEGDILNQDWAGTIDLLKQFPVSFAAGVRLSRLSRGYTSMPETYFLKLKEAFSLLGTWDSGEESERSGSLKVEIDATGRGFSLKTVPGIAYRGSNFAEGFFSATESISISAPFALQFNPPAELRVEPYYSLDLKYSAAGYKGINLNDDIEALARVLKKQQDLLTFPVYDLFADALTETFTAATVEAESAAYLSAAGITVARGFGSYLRDLFLPARLDMELRRSLQRSEDSVTDDLAIHLRFRSSALNLFGSRGAYPICSFYQSDEYAWNVGFKADLLSAQTNTYALLVQHLLYFQGSDRSELSVSNRTEIAFSEQVVWNETFEPTFSWITPLPGGISLPFTNIEFKNDVYFKHQESLSLNISGPEVEFGLLIGHSSELFLSDRGSVRGLLHAGVSFEDGTWLLGMDGGLRAKVTF